MPTVAPDPLVHAPARAHVELCGSLVAEIGGRRVDAALPGRKGRQLFACLVVGRHRAMSRDELIDMVWPHDPPSDPDGALSTLLTRLRTALGPETVIGRSELMLALGDDPWVDWEVARSGVSTAEARLAAGEPRAALEVAVSALEIARRPLLAGVSTPWLEDRRRELAESRAGLLESVARAALAVGGDNLPAAERNARELIALEPYRESAYALLMEVHAARGNQAEALLVFDALRRLLREELGMSPSPSLGQLAGRLLEQDAAPAGPASTSLAPAPHVQGPLPTPITAAVERPLAGRPSELHRLSTEVLRPSTRPCRVLAVSGEAGIGKTRLAAEVAVRAHTAGCEVLHGRAQRDAVTPYQPFIEALRQHLAHDQAVAEELTPLLRPELEELAHFLPELRHTVSPAAAPERVDPDVRRRRAFSGVSALCDAIARRRPLLLILEDLHWADQATLRMVRHVVQSAREGQTTILATFRDDVALPVELKAVLVDLLRERALTRLSLGALDEPAIAELVSSRLGCAPEVSELRAIKAQAGGNPFFVEQLLQHASNDGLPAGVRDTVELRLHDVPARALGILRTAAAAGPTFDVATVARRADASCPATRDVVRQAIRSGLVIARTGRPERFAFRHGLVRHALYASEGGPRG